MAIISSNMLFWNLYEIVIPQFDGTKCLTSTIITMMLQMCNVRKQYSLKRYISCIAYLLRIININLWSKYNITKIGKVIVLTM